MKTVTTISREGLNRFYGGNIPLMTSYCKLSDVTYHSIDAVVPATQPIIGLDSGTYFSCEELQVLILKARKGNDYSRVLVPKNIVETIQVEDVRDIMERVLTDMLPGRWFREGPTFYLYYPEITITNSNGENHTIYDLVVKICIDIHTDTIVNEIHGLRYSFNKKELKASYVHSHLPKRTEGFNRFCLGSSDFERFIRNNFNKVDEQVIRTFLMQLELYLSWESLEGKPHISMSAINTIQNENINPDITKDVRTELSYYCLDFIKEMKTSWLVRYYGSFQYVFDPALEPDEVYELEIRLTEKYKRNPVLHNLMADYDPALGFYSRGLDQQVGLPNVSTYNSIAARLGITPRLLETEEVASPLLIKRFPPNVINYIVTEINNLLRNNSKVDEEDNVRTQSEDNNIPAVSEPSLVSA